MLRCFLAIRATQSLANRLGQMMCIPVTTSALKSVISAFFNIHSIYVTKSDKNFTVLS